MFNSDQVNTDVLACNQTTTITNNNNNKISEDIQTTQTVFAAILFLFTFKCDFGCSEMTEVCL